MGRHSSFVYGYPLPLEAVKLGRLVEDPKRPDSGFFDPSETLPSKPEPRSDTIHINNISRLLKAGNGSGLELTIAAFASTWLKGENKNVQQLKAKAGRQSLLLNSTQWFEQICTAYPTRLWLEQRAMVGRRTYLVTGLETLIDTEVSTEKSFSVGAGVDLQVPALIVASVPVPVPTPIDPKVKLDYSIERGKENGYQIPDEKVYKVRYREIKLKKTNAPGDILAKLSSKVWWEQICSDRSASVDEDLERDSTDFVEADISDGFEQLPSYEFVEDGEDSEMYIFESLSAGADQVVAKPD